MSIFTDDELAAEATTAADAPQEAAPAVDQQDDGRPRNPDGTFAPKAADAVADEAPADGEAAEQGDDKQSRQVPQGALHAERERRKGVESQLRAAQEQLQAIATMRAQIAARQPEPIAAPEANADDASKLAYLTQQIEQIQGAQQQSVQQSQMAQLQQVEERQIGDLVTRSEAAFRATKPDYDEAINHVVNARAQELALYGMGPSEIQAFLREEVIEIAKSAVQQGRDPAEVAYQLAQFRGYRPGSGQVAQQQQNGAAATVAAVAAAKAGSRSLGQAAGSTPTQGIDAKAVASMSPEEFEALYSTPEGRRMIDAL